MNYDDFLLHRGGDPLRGTLWAHYQQVASYFSSQLGYALQVVRVCEGGACWWLSGPCITIPFDKNDCGAIFHEATHDLFHHSVFHPGHNSANKFPPGHEEDAAYNEGWGEGFCEAVRWLMESTYLPGSAWLSKWPTEVKTDWRKQRVERILSYTGHSLVQFAAGWNNLVAGYDGTADYLNRSIP